MPSHLGTLSARLSFRKEPRHGKLESWSAGTTAVTFCSHIVQGQRDYQEDALGSCLAKRCLVLGVFDGHYGPRCAEWSSARLPKRVVQDVGRQEIGNRCDATAMRTLLHDAFLGTDRDWAHHAAKQSLRDGSTATLAVLHADTLYVANVGDSRCVACVAGAPIDLSVDHTARRADERARVEAAGGSVSATGRVNGKLAVSRALGDIPFKAGKPLVTAEPEVRELRVSSDLQFVVVASDGLWDVYSGDGLLRAVRALLSAGTPHAQLARNLCERALEMGSQDNVSVCVLLFHHQQSDASTASGSINPPSLRSTLSGLGRAFASRGASQRSTLSSGCPDSWAADADSGRASEGDSPGLPAMVHDPLRQTVVDDDWDGDRRTMPEPDEAAVAAPGAAPPGITSYPSAPF